MKSGTACDILDGTPSPGGIGLRPLSTIIALLAAAAFMSCSGDLNIGEYTFACETDPDCGAGYRCDQSTGCVKIVVGNDGGGHDAGKPDGGTHPGDAGGEIDGGTDTGHIDGGDAGDAGFEDAAIVDGGDTGSNDGGPPDAGPPRDGGYIIRFSSVYDTAAGTCAGTGYTLKSVTGWTAGFRWSAGGYTLQPGEPYKK